MFGCDFRTGGESGIRITRKRSFNNIERTAGTVKQYKTVVISANGSQTDHDGLPLMWVRDSRLTLKSGITDRAAGQWPSCVWSIKSISIRTAGATGALHK
jgi:hypothetical protein